MITCFHEVVLDNFLQVSIFSAHPQITGARSTRFVAKFPAHNVICYVILIWVYFTQSIQKSRIPRTKDGDRWGNIMFHCCPLGGRIGIAISVPMTHDSINAVHIKMSCCKQKIRPIRDRKSEEKHFALNLLDIQQQPQLWSSNKTGLWTLHRSIIYQSAAMHRLMFDRLLLGPKDTDIAYTINAECNRYIASTLTVYNSSPLLQMGCQANVLPYVDSVCSGRQECNLQIPSISLQGIRPCSEELISYLEASYSCLPGKDRWLIVRLWYPYCVSCGDFKLITMDIW